MIDEQKLMDVPHVEIRRTDERKILDVDLREGITPAAKFLREILGGKEQESFVILILDAAGRATAWREVARGRQDRVEVPTRELFRTALLCDAAYLILAHNHPSGDPTPSLQDRLMTVQLKMAGDSIGIRIVDHIIIGDRERYYSMARDEGMSTTVQNMSGDREPPEL